MRITLIPRIAREIVDNENLVKSSAAATTASLPSSTRG